MASNIGGENGHLVIDLRYFDHVVLDPETWIANVGPGRGWETWLWHCMNKGGERLRMGVGITLDFLLSAEIVLANGSHVRTSRTQYPDLFWALRGAGMSYGISWYLIISAQGGPTSLVSLIPPTSTSYAHRSQLFEWQFVTGVASSSSPFPIQQAYSFLNPMIAEIENAEGKEESGMYYNYADSALSADEAHKRYWLGNYEKLARIKGMLDPREVFMSPQSVNSD
ncbi:glucooligosaccharide oxidase [Botrytis cinerea]